MATIYELFDYALKAVPDAQHIHVKQGVEEISVMRAQQPVILNPHEAVQHQSSTAVMPMMYSQENETVTSPLVGIFYAAPEPGAAPFVTAGSRVKKGDTLCIIEAMKLMNEIESPHDGVIGAVLAENGAMVEFGQPLFEVKPE